MDLLGTEGRVVFTDVSPDLIARCREVAAEFDVLERCDFVVDSLPALSEHADSSADVVVLRSVLIYVSDKQGAFENLHRVLKAGGRFSLFEPIVGFAFPEPSGWLWELEVRGFEDLADKVHVCYRRYQEHDDPMVDFDERDLFHAALEAGFVNVKMTYEALVEDHPPYEDVDWETFLRAAPNPNAPSNGEILREGPWRTH